jgi:hypothetical protein
MLPGNKDKTLRHKEMPVTDARPWWHFWHEHYHRCVIISVEETDGGHVSIRFRQTNTNGEHIAVYPRDTTLTKVWNIKMSNNVQYGSKRFKR